MERAIGLEDGWCVGESEKGSTAALWVRENLINSIRDKNKYYITSVVIYNSIEVGVQVVEEVFTEGISSNTRFGLLVG